MRCVRFAELHRTRGANNLTVAQFQIINTKRCKVQIIQRVCFWSTPSTLFALASLSVSKDWGGGHIPIYNSGLVWVMVTIIFGINLSWNDIPNSKRFI